VAGSGSPGPLLRGTAPATHGPGSPTPGRVRGALVALQRVQLPGSWSREKVGVGDTRSRCTGSQQRAEAPLTCHAFPDATAPLQKFGPFYGSLGEYYQIGRKEFLVSYIIKVFRPFEPIRIDPTTQRRTRFAYEVSTPTGVWLRSRARVARAPPHLLSPFSVPFPPSPPLPPGHATRPRTAADPARNWFCGSARTLDPSLQTNLGTRSRAACERSAGSMRRRVAGPAGPQTPGLRGTLVRRGSRARESFRRGRGRFVRGRGQGGRGGASAGRRGPRGDGRVQGEGPRARRPCAPAPTAGGMRPDPAPRTRPRQRLEDVDSVWVSERLQISGPHGPDLGNRTPVWVFLCRKGASCFPSAPLHFRAAIIRI
jgi:hypothetical protein